MLYISVEEELYFR